MTSKWPTYVALATVSVSGINFAYLSSENEQNRELSVSNQTLRASMFELQNELQAVKGQLNELRIALRSPAPASSAALSQPSKGRPPTASRAQALATLRSDSRFNQLQKQLSEQQKQLANTREDLDKTRENLEGSLSSTKNELSGSVARNHDELVALQKRGERNYYEFHLTRSKTFERVGPLRLSLRKADIKHKRFDIMMLVDDNELQKKGVNLYETLLFNLADRPQPLEVVVNKISKDAVVGYVSEPKYKRSELSASAGLTP
jgi:DNA repair exonuclease SbcCD ATPase subunit